MGLHIHNDVTPQHRISRDELFMGMADLVSARSTCLRGQTGAVIVKDKRPVSIGYNGAPPGLPSCVDIGQCEPATEWVDLETYYQVAGVELEGAAIRAKSDVLNKWGCQRAIHAELNAIAWAARRGLEIHGATMYCISAPCLKCAQAIIAAGIMSVVWRNPYRAQRLDLLEEAKVLVTHYE